MAHYAFLNENNVVTEVITGVDENTLIDGVFPEAWYANFRGMKCKRTSYNGNIRKHYAGIGFTYDEERDAFIPPKPFNSWILNEETLIWEAPVAMPEDSNAYTWDEINKEWKVVESWLTGQN